MAKKILAILFVSILLCSYIIPTTSAFADVVIGDNDSYAVTELGVKNGKRIATMEAILQLLESGVSEIDFNDISDLDDYLDDFYDELTNVNYQDVSNELLAGAYNDVNELKKWIDDRGEYIGTYYKDYLNSADEGLSDIFNQFQLKLPKTTLTGTSLNGFKSLSRFNNGGDSPQPNIPSDIQVYIDIINKREDAPNRFWLPFHKNPTNHYYDGLDISNYTWFVYSGDWQLNTYDEQTGSTYNFVNTPQNIYINSVNDNSYNCQFYWTGSIYSYYHSDLGRNYDRCSFIYNTNTNYIAFDSGTLYVRDINFNHTGTLQQIFNALKDKVKNVNIYVDNVPWATVGQIVVLNPTIDLDGFVKLYGNDNPIQYEFPQGTQIDYNALYTTIYNAIRDNLPLDMQTINNNQVYYDSHDTIYSPTIYNYYGKDGDDENDWIDSILDYATIPDFNSALGTVAVLDAPFVNGITIVNAGIIDVIPTDILVILGGFFVLVLFVCIINRMSE